MKTTMRQRAREIIEEVHKIFNDNFLDYEFFLMVKIATCDEVIKCFRNGDSKIDICPFPKALVMRGGESACRSCEYFSKGYVDDYRCGCDLALTGQFTVNQAINGLRIFKSEMKKYLKEKQRCPGV